MTTTTESNDALLEAQRRKQAQLIHQLKGQLEELESYAYESGEGTMPSNVLLERQRVVMGNVTTSTRHLFFCTKFVDNE